MNRCDNSIGVYVCAGIGITGEGEVPRCVGLRTSYSLKKKNIR